MWEYWIYGLAVFFIVVVSWIAVTPAYNQLTGAIDAATNFDSVEINASVHSLTGYNSNSWNKWPLVAAVVIFLLIFYFAVEDKPVKYPRY